MNGDQIVIQTTGLSKQYKGVNALQGLNLQVAQHSIFGFLGPNGAGKSTAIKLLLGLIRPTNGHAAAFGLDSVQDSVAIRQRVGYLAQDPRYYQHMTARETMRFSARFFYRGPKEAIEARIEETLILVGLEDKADRPIKGFSGGERQRLGIAQAQVNYPDLLILDEPAAALDPMGRRDVLEVMARLRKHTTIFYSTHILDDVQRVSDSVAILNHGQLVAQAPIEQLLATSSGGSMYSLTVRGDGQPAQQALLGQPWVIDVSTHPNHTDTTLQICVSDETMAEAQLLRLVLADKQTAVTEFGRKKYNLEEIFLQMVDGGQTFLLMGATVISIGVVTTVQEAVVGIGVYLLFLVRTGDMFYAQTMLTYTVITCGILLIIFVEPPTKWWVGGDSLSGDRRPTILAVGLLLLFAVFLAVPFLRDFYGLILLRSWTHYFAITLAAAIWVVLVRLVWRANLVERYLNVDLGRSKGTS